MSLQSDLWLTAECGKSFQVLRPIDCLSFFPLLNEYSLHWPLLHQVWKSHYQQTTKVLYIPFNCSRYPSGLKLRYCNSFWLSVNNMLQLVVSADCLQVQERTWISWRHSWTRLKSMAAQKKRRWIWERSALVSGTRLIKNMSMLAYWRTTCLELSKTVGRFCLFTDRGRMKVTNHPAGGYKPLLPLNPKVKSCRLDHLTELCFKAGTCSN